MGRMVCAGLAGEPDLVLVGTSGRDARLGEELAKSRPDVLVEFTLASAAPEAITTALSAGVHVVSGTTGIAQERVRELARLCERVARGCILAPNFALGMVLLQRCAEQLARHFPAIEIVELHHAAKKDAPSGTALATAASLEAVRGAPGIPIHSVRLPGLVAHQELLFGGTGQVLTLRHDAFDRTAYLPGILLAIRAVVRRKGLLDSIAPLLDDGTEDRPPGTRP